MHCCLLNSLSLSLFLGLNGNPLFLTLLNSDNSYGLIAARQGKSNWNHLIWCSKTTLRLCLVVCENLSVKHMAKHWWKQNSSGLTGSLAFVKICISDQPVVKDLDIDMKLSLPAAVKIDPTMTKWKKGGLLQSKPINNNKISQRKLTSNKFN